MLDTYARTALWQVGLNYRHGTGHGVGAFLTVHEGRPHTSPVKDNHMTNFCIFQSDLHSGFYFNYLLFYTLNQH